MQIVFHYDAGPVLARRLLTLARDGIEVATCAEADAVRFAELMTRCEVLWHVLKPVTAEAIAGAPQLRLIQKIGVGVNTIDLDAARRRGIAVCNMPGTNSRAVAEMTLALMFSALRRLPAFDAAVRRGAGWRWDAAIQDDLGEIGGRTVGLVGAGAVPRILAPVLHALGARPLYASRNAKPDFPAERRDLPALLAEADIVSLHLPLTAETERIIDGAALARMKPGAILVNTARGGLVDQDALAAALRSGRLRAAGLDVFAEEPVATDNPFLDIAATALTPHIAWLTAETLERSLVVAIENCHRLSRGHDLLHRIV
jgi:phosphoglycerate dehydrogenase-like enzyme